MRCFYLRESNLNLAENNMYIKALSVIACDVSNAHGPQLMLYSGQNYSAISLPLQRCNQITQPHGLIIRNAANSPPTTFAQFQCWQLKPFDMETNNYTRPNSKFVTKHATLTSKAKCLSCFSYLYRCLQGVFMLITSGVEFQYSQMCISLCIMMT